MVAHRVYGGVRWLDPAENPMEGISYSKRGTVEGAHRSWVPPSQRPSATMVDSLAEVIAAAPVWPWQPVQFELGVRCGPRLAEQLGLRDIDIDLGLKVLRIHHSVRWPRPSKGIEWGLKPTKTKTRRETPYPTSLHEQLLALCAARLGLPVDATVAEVTAAQDAKRRRKFARLDAATLEKHVPRRIEPDEGLLFAVGDTGRPPTKEILGDRWRAQRAQSTWSPDIPWRNARHHTVMWWRANLADPVTGELFAWERIAPWLGHDVQTLLAHYVRTGEGDAAAVRPLLDRL